MDGEIMEDDVNPELIRQNQLEVKARAVLAASTKSEVYSTLKMSESKDPQPTGNPNHTTHTASISSGVPEEMLCLICMDNRKEVMIQSCRHLVYCRQCEHNYNLKNLHKRECPICRKEYKKTHIVLYS